MSTAATELVVLIVERVPYVNRAPARLTGKRRQYSPSPGMAGPSALLDVNPMSHESLTTFLDRGNSQLMKRIDQD